MSDSYYGRPIVKPHVWHDYIAVYFWIGGAAGAASVATVAARVAGNDALATVQKRAALVGALFAPVLLIADLGVPARFLNMLRVFKPTSPMSVGSWILSAYGSTVGASTAAELFGWRRTALALEWANAFIGPALTTYTAVLIADTATPIWHEAYRELPFVFVASGVAGAGALGVAFTAPQDAVAARRLMVAGALGVFATTEYMERRLGRFLSEPYRHGAGGVLTRVSSLLALTGALLGVLAGKRRTVGRIAALAVAASGLCERFAVFAAGKDSALDPKYVVESQRERLEALRRRES